jgi:hypothetical protein
MKRKILVLIISMFFTTSLFANPLFLETIGAMGGANIYLTYISIGILADSYPKEVYDKEQAINLLSSIERQAVVQKGYLDKMMKSNDVSSEDKAFIKKMIGCYNLLIDESKYLVEYLNTGKESAIKNFHSKREQAWKSISEILGLNE